MASDRIRGPSVPDEQGRQNSTDPQLERAEADAVLASEMFKRARSLRQILSYVCEQYFSGGTPNIKEYNIAVEALGRGASFDPNADTIVRVEASRLRKRLREYYATEGAGHPLQLFLPPTGYVPQFVPRQVAEAADQTAESAAIDEVRVPAPRAGNRNRVLRIAVGIGILAVAASVVIVIFRGHGSEPPKERIAASTPAQVAAPAVAEATPGEAVRILAGYTRPQFVDSLGRSWTGDRYFQGGATQEWTDDIVGVTDPTLYRTGRLGREFRYDIPLKPGVYEMRLLFVETYFGKLQTSNSGEGSRVFAVAVNGVTRLPAIDIFADAGGADIPADRVLTDISPAQDGFLHLMFTGLSDWAALSGIELVRSTPGRMLPVRIVAGGRSYEDSSRRFWGADRYFSGGRSVRRIASIQGTSDPELYTNSRWGRFTYSIPVAPQNKYRVTLRFAEMFLTAPGQRIFDVYCNGVALLRNFDIFREAGTAARTVDRSFHGVAPDGQGRLVLSFVPVRDYATVMAIEVVDEGK